MAVFNGLKKGGQWGGDKWTKASEEEERDIKKEKFEKEIAQ